jgi:hypothetical protein
VGLEVTTPSQIVHYQGYWYRYGGSLPHTITGASPSLDDNDNWFNLGNDVSLRANLGSGELPGTGIVSLTTTLQNRFRATFWAESAGASTVNHLRAEDSTVAMEFQFLNSGGAQSCLVRERLRLVGFLMGHLPCIRPAVKVRLALSLTTSIVIPQPAFTTVCF